MIFKLLRHVHLKSRSVFISRDNTSTSKSFKSQDSRRDSRIEVTGLRAEISDGIITHSGLVTNISMLGICIKDVPERLSSARSLLSIVIRNGSENYRIVARPRWENVQTNKGKTIGAEIARSPDSWGTFVFSQ